MKFFTSDVHLGNKRTIKIDGRPFNSIKEMNNFFINLWNKQASKNDTIYCIGDLLNCSTERDKSYEDSIKLIKKIKAKIVLIIGNNEERIIKYYFNNDFENFRQFCIKNGIQDVVKNLEMEIADVNFYLVHKPKECKLDMLNLYGHIHKGGGVYSPIGFNVGCDLNYLKPYSEEDISHLIAMRKTFWEEDENIKFTYKN